jgi:hypothetical protein
LPELLARRLSPFRHVGRDIKGEAESLFRRSRRVGGKHIAQQGAEFEGRDPKLQFPRLNLRKIEDVIDHPQQMFAALVHDAQPFALIGCEPRVSLQDLA